MNKQSLVLWSKWHQAQQNKTHAAGSGLAAECFSTALQSNWADRQHSIHDVSRGRYRKPGKPRPGVSPAGVWPSQDTRSKHQRLSCRNEIGSTAV